MAVFDEATETRALNGRAVVSLIKQDSSKGWPPFFAKSNEPILLLDSARQAALHARFIKPLTTNYRVPDYELLEFIFGWDAGVQLRAARALGDALVVLLRYCKGVEPVQRLKARSKALTSE